MTAIPDAVVLCPHCGGVLLVRPAALSVATDADDRAREVPSTSTSTKNTAALRAAVQSCTSTSTCTARARSEQGTLPLPPTLAKPASTWKRLIAIAHKAIDEWPDNAASQTDRCKELCAQQGIAYGELGVDGRPLYARALDFALAQRRRRAGGAR